MKWMNKEAETHGIENLSQHRFVLNNGSGDIPALGFGTSISDDKQTRNAVKTAVEVEFRQPRRRQAVSQRSGGRRGAQRVVRCQNGSPRADVCDHEAVEPALPKRMLRRGVVRNMRIELPIGSPWEAVECLWKHEFLRRSMIPRPERS